MMNKLFRIPYWAFLALLIYMPFHIFISQWASTLTGGLEVWKVWKDVLLFLAVLTSFALVYIKNGFKDRFFWLISGLSALYVAFHFLIWALNPDIEDGPALLGTVYNSRLFGYLIVGFATAILLKTIKNRQQTIKKLFMISIVISTVVCMIALIQWFLPKDILTHFGYSVERGVKPNFFIDDKPDLPRLFSTLRDPNSLGAYLILPITLLSAAWFKLRSARIMIGGLLLLHGLILFLTFSRSSWLGAFLAVVMVLLWQYKVEVQEFLKKFWPVLFVIFSLLFIGVYVARDNYVVQNVVLHADENTQLAGSNERHLKYTLNGIEDVSEEPEGYGPGTAGPVSLQTKKHVLPENYFVQIAYEVGVAGLMLLLTTMFLIIKQLYGRHDFYSRIMISAFAGITLCAILLHTWANEAVAAQWWLFAGLILAFSSKKRTKLS